MGNSLYIISRPAQALVLILMDSKDMCLGEWNCWYNEVLSKVYKIHAAYGINNISIVGNTKYADKIEELVNNKFSEFSEIVNIERRRCLND